LLLTICLVTPGNKGELLNVRNEKYSGKKKAARVTGRPFKNFIQRQDVIGIYTCLIIMRQPLLRTTTN